MRWQIASTEPTETEQPNSSPQSSEASRREMRLRTESRAIAACRRGPKALAPTPSGNDARVLFPQPEQRTEWARCSVILTAIGGSSMTWWRWGAAARSWGSPGSKPRPQPEQRFGQCSTISSSSDSATSLRALPSWPGCPPCLRVLDSRFG